MDVTIMPPSTLLERIHRDFPSIVLIEGDTFSWHPQKNQVTYSPTDLHSDEHLLHELSHALLKHSSYERDIDLIAMERDAWAYARTTLAPRYEVTVSSDVIQANMDTYRDWLHARSTCPTCSATGLQIKKKTYQCVSCRAKWQVNEAKMCRLQRHRAA